MLLLCCRLLSLTLLLLKSLVAACQSWLPLFSVPSSSQLHKES